MARSPHPQILWVRADTEQVTLKNSEHCAQPFIKEVEGARTQRGMSDPNTETLVRDMGRCATPNKLEIEMARTKKDSSELKTVVIRAEVHAENTEAEHLVHFEESDDFSDAGSLITQAPQSQSIHATINALSSWVSAIQPRESWYLAGWIGDSPIDFLVDPGAVVSAISLPCYEKLMEANAILTPMRAIRMELEAANKSDMRVHGMCNLDLSVHGLIINMDTLVVDLNCHAILGMDVLGDASKLPFILDLVGGTLSGGGYETIQLHRFQAATECFAETTDSVCIPPHSEVMLWAKLKTNNGRRGPTAGVVLALQTFVQEFGLLVGRSLVRADAEDWKIPILIYNSDPCTMQPDACTCNPVILPAHTRAPTPFDRCSGCSNRIDCKSTCARSPSVGQACQNFPCSRYANYGAHRSCNARYRHWLNEPYKMQSEKTVSEKDKDTAGIGG